MDGFRLAWFVEADRSTESLKVIERKARQYLRYWRTGTEQQRLGTFPRVLWSVPDESRADGVRRTLGALPAPTTSVFGAATSERTSAVLLGESEKEEQTTTEGGAR